MRWRTVHVWLDEGGFVESEHPRAPSGTGKGGEFVKGETEGSISSSSGASTSEKPLERARGEKASSELPSKGESHDFELSDSEYAAVKQRLEAASALQESASVRDLTDRERVGYLSRTLSSLPVTKGKLSDSVGRAIGIVVGSTETHEGQEAAAAAITKAFRSVTSNENERGFAVLLAMESMVRPYLRYDLTSYTPKASSGGFEGPILEQMYDVTKDSKIAAYVRPFELFSDRYDEFLPAFVTDWTYSGNSDALRRAYAALSDFGPNAKKRFWNGKPPLTRGEEVASPRMQANLNTLYKATQAFYKKKLRADPRTKTVMIKRGVGIDATSYSPASVESWSKDSRTPARFGELMAHIHGKHPTFSVLSATVHYSDVLMSWESLQGVWPPEKNLKGKKEVVVLGGGLTDIEKEVHNA